MLTVESTFALVSVADPTISAQIDATDHAPSPLAADMLIPLIADDDVDLSSVFWWVKVEGPGTTKADTEGSRTRNTESLMVMEVAVERAPELCLKKQDQQTMCSI